MYIYSLLILLFLSTRRRTAIACPLGQPVDNSALLYDFTNFQPGLDPVSKQPIETDDVMNNNYPDGLVEQTQPPPIMPGIISTSSEDTTTTTTIGAPPPITDDSCRLGAVQFQPSSPSSTFDTAGGSSFELAEALPGRKLGPPAPVTPLETVYLCCESVGEDKYVCDSTPQNDRLVRDVCPRGTVYECPKDRLITSLAMECQDKSIERATRQSGAVLGLSAAFAILKCIVTDGLRNGPLACIGLPSIPE